MTVYQAKRLGIANFSLLVSHVLVPPAIAAIMESPTCRVQAFLAAGHVCSVMGTARVPAARREVPACRSWSPASSRWTSWRASGGPSLQLEAGRHELENAYPRAVPRRGQPGRRWRCCATSSRSPTAPGAASAMIPAAAGGCPSATATSTPSSGSRSTDIHTEESPICRSGEVLQGLIKPHECAAFGKECTPRNPLGATMVSSEGACAAYYTVPPARAGGRAVTCLRRDDLDFEGWVCPLPLRDTPTIVMGHGGGGAMSGELVEHLFLPAFGGAADAELGDSAVLPCRPAAGWRSPPTRSW